MIELLDYEAPAKGSSSDRTFILEFQISLLKLILVFRDFLIIFDSIIFIRDQPRGGRTHHNMSKMLTCFGTSGQPPDVGVLNS